MANVTKGPWPNELLNFMHSNKLGQTCEAEILIQMGIFEMAKQ